MEDIVLQFTSGEISRKCAALRRSDRAWGLLPNLGCLAFVIVDRYVRDDGIEYRFAVSQGASVLDPNPGATCFRGVVIAARRRMVTIARVGDVEPAEPGRSLVEMKAAARGILARLPGSKYRALVLSDTKPSAVFRRFERKSFGFFFGTRLAHNV